MKKYLSSHASGISDDGAGVGRTVQPYTVDTVVVGCEDSLYSMAVGVVRVTVQRELMGHLWEGSNECTWKKI